MTPEERAAQLKNELHADWFSDPEVALTAAIKAAENDMAERAAHTTALHLMATSLLAGDAIKDIQALIRSLKHNEANP